MSETIPADSGPLGKDSAVCVRLFRCQERTSLLLFLLLCDTQAKHTRSWTHGSRGYSARARVPAFVLDEASNRRHPKMVNLLDQQRAKKKPGLCFSLCLSFVLAAIIHHRSPPIRPIHIQNCPAIEFLSPLR